MSLRTSSGRILLICYASLYFILFTIFHFIDLNLGRAVEIGFTIIGEVMIVVIICYALRRYSSPRKVIAFTIGVLFMLSRLLLILGNSYEIFNWIPIENAVISRTCYLLGKVLFLIVLLIIVASHRNRKWSRMYRLVMTVEIISYVCIAAIYLSLLWLEPQNFIVKGMHSAFYVIFDLNAIFFALYVSTMFQRILQRNERMALVAARVVFLINSVIVMLYALVFQTMYFSSSVHSYLIMAESVSSLALAMVMVSLILNAECVRDTKLTKMGESSIFQSIQKNIIPIFWVYPTLYFSIHLHFEPITQWLIFLGGLLLLTRQIMSSLEDHGFITRYLQLHDSFDGQIEVRTQQLLISEQKYRSLFDQMEESFIVLNVDLQIVNHNPAFDFFMQEHFHAHCRQGGILCIMKQDAEFWNSQIQEVLKGNKISFQKQVHSDLNGLLHLVVTVFPYILDGQILGILILLKDHTKAYEAEQHIHRLAYFDQLTDMLNRHAFFEQIEPLFITQQQASLLFIDMDKLKEINDRYGHSFGDAMLSEVARRAKNILADDGMICRFSGDEFLIFLPEYDVKQTEYFVKRLIEALEVVFNYNGANLSIFCSVGIAQFPADGATLDELINRAVTAMYQVKKGKSSYSYFFYNETVSAEMKRKSLIRDALKYAIAEKQLMLYYQPQYDILNNEFTGMEALIRWKHPELGFIPPTEFIAIAEEDGIINRIGDWVVEEACAQLHTWSQMEISKPVAINVSLKQLEQENFVQHVVNAADRYLINRELLKIEITESIAMSSTKYAVEALQDLKNYGFSISMDDFGTGYSSMSYLMSYPIDSLKIDRAFIGDISSTNKVKLVDIIVNMAHQLDLHVIAEGVETKEQLNYLRNLDCRYVQGYYISRPLPADEITALMSSGTDPFIDLVR